MPNDEYIYQEIDGHKLVVGREPQPGDENIDIFVEEPFNPNNYYPFLDWTNL